MDIAKTAHSSEHSEGENCAEHESLENNRETVNVSCGKPKSALKAALSPKLAVPKALNKVFLRLQPSQLVPILVPLSLSIIAGTAVLLPESLPSEARLALFALMLAAILWATTSISADYVALGIVMLLVLTGGSSQEQLFEALASDAIWLLIGAFILGSAVQKTGLAARLTQLVIVRARNVRSLFWLLTNVLIPLSFFIPTNSGRAALTIPVFRSLTLVTRDRRVIRSLALLIPTIILISATVALASVGSHLIANDLLSQMTGQRFSFSQWAMYGLPFGLVASYLCCWTIMHLFLDRHCLNQKLQGLPFQPKPLSRTEWITLLVILAMVVLWLTERWHGLEIATITLAGAMLLTLPKIGVLSWKEGISSVSWHLIVFVGAALVLARSLTDSGAAQWTIDRTIAVFGVAQTGSHLVVLVLLAAISLTSHLYITSHTARAAALIPTLLYLASSLQLNPAAVAFIGTLGLDYSLTFPVSSKALLMFQAFEGATYKPADLLRLSSIMLPVHLGLIVVFYYGYWRWMGLAL